MLVIGGLQAVSVNVATQIRDRQATVASYIEKGGPGGKIRDVINRCRVLRSCEKNKHMHQDQEEISQRKIST